MCTATLVHPRLITLAAHCVADGDPQEIFLGDTTDHDGPGRRVAIESCQERGGTRDGEDFAYCLLAEPVSDVPIIPILFGCELDLLRPNERVVLVGFGNIDEDTPAPGGHKRWVTAPVADIKEKTIDLGDPGHSNCFGDSGGPAYVQLPDGTWRVFGATSTTYTVDGVGCLREGTWALTPYYVPWIEETSGLDVTPCYDVDGTWNPGPDCTNVPLNPGESTGTWDQMCRQGQRLSGPLATCGGPLGAKLPDPPASGGAAGSGGTGGALSTGGLAGGGGAGGNGQTAGAAPAQAGSAGSIAATTEPEGNAAAIDPLGPSNGVVSGEMSCQLTTGASDSGTVGLAALALVGLVRRRRSSKQRLA